MREGFSVAICVVSAAVAVALIKLGYSMTLVLFYTSVAWAIACESLRGTQGLKGYWRLKMSQIYQAARQGELKQTKLGRVIGGGFLLLMLASIVSLFVR